MGKFFGTNGIRGVVNQTITAEFMCKICQCLSVVFPKGSNIIVGMDGRKSSPMLQMAAIAGLTSVGINVWDVGYAPTPSVQYAVPNEGADGAVIITASHNPPEFNGMKVIAKDGIEIPRDQEERIEGIFQNENVKLVTWKQVGRVYEREINESYIQAILTKVDKDLIQTKQFTVVVDPGNGVGGITTPQVLARLGCKVVTVNGQLDGMFPGRNPEPTPENLAQLGSVVTAHGAAFGVAHDGDADRAIFVDEKGEVVWGDQTFALIARFVLNQLEGGTIVTPIASGNTVKEVIESEGGSIVWTRVGSILVSRKLVELQGILGGEENGGIFYPPMHPVRDGGMTTALITQLIASSNTSLSHLVNQLPKYYIKKSGVPCPNEKKVKVLERILIKTKTNDRNTLDGVKLFYPDGSILIRASGTEPKFRCFAEATTEKKVNEYLKSGLELITSSIQDTN